MFAWISVLVPFYFCHFINYHAKYAYALFVLLAIDQVKEMISYMYIDSFIPCSPLLLTIFVFGAEPGQPACFFFLCKWMNLNSITQFLDILIRWNKQ